MRVAAEENEILVGQGAHRRGKLPVVVTRRPAWQSASQRRATASLEIGIGLSDEMIQPASTGIRFNLGVPRIGGKLLEPHLESGKILTGQSGNGDPKFLDAHRAGGL